MLSKELVFGSSDAFEVTAVQRLEDQVILSVQSGKTQGTCPGCQVNSHKLHSYYKRKIKDYATPQFLDSELM
jgi:transposase